MKKLLTISVLLVCAGTVFSCKQKIRPAHSTIADEGTIIGIVRMHGNMPHPSLVIAGTFNQDNVNRTYYVIGEKKRELMRLQFKKVEVKGTIKRSILRLAGKSGKTRERYTIRIHAYKVLE